MSEDDSSFEGHEFDQPLLDKHKPTRKAPKRGLRNILNLVAFASTYVLVFAGGYLIHQHGYVKCREVYEYDDPNLMPRSILNHVRSMGAQKPFHVFEPTTVFPYEPTQPWERPPGPEVEPFWEQYMKPFLLLTTREDMARQGKDPDKYVSIPPDWGYGDHIFLTILDTHHHIHCLNVLRKMVYRHHFFPNMSVHEEGQWRHSDHCIKILYETLACHNSWDVYNLIWVEGFPHPLREKSVSRQCRDIGDLWHFIEENNVIDDERLQQLMPGENVYFTPVTPGSSGLPKVSDHELREQISRYIGAMEKWRTTGEIPVNKDFAGDAVI